MKTLFVKWMIVAGVAAFLLPALAGAQTWDITGIYALYQKGVTGKVVGHMRISNQHGNTFSIGIATPTGDPANDWQGEGVIEGLTGYYTWKFTDGKTGRTTFSIDSEGNLYGQVRGSGINWDYVALKI